MADKCKRFKFFLWIFPLIIFILNFLLQIIFILVSVAFFTLLERKVLGYTHFRFGPNKVGPLGIFQPFSDAIKLFSKENLKFKILNYIIFFLSPVLGIIVMMISWIFIPWWGRKYNRNLSMLILLCIIRVSIYFLIGTGWSSNSKYRILGSYRSIAQAISYEVRMFLIILSLVWCLRRYRFNNFITNYNYYFYLLIPLFVCWLLTILAESNRTPFDFTEGESELVSGFNTEYRSGLFSLIFICEYGSILFFSSLTVIIFLSNSYLSFKIIILSFFYLWIRSTFPRLRYDRLILIAWKRILMISLGVLILSFFLINF